MTGESWTAVEGRSNDHVRSRSKAKAWQPVNDRGQKIRVFGEGLTHSTEHTSDLQDKHKFCTPRYLARPLCRLQCLEFQL